MRATYAEPEPYTAYVGTDDAAGALLPMVLLVDDERDALDALEAALLNFGYRVTTAGNGADAIEKATRDLPEAVITDLLMPVVDGIALAKALRSNPATAHVKIVMCSGVSEGSVRAIFDRYDAFLHKPYDLRDLRAVLAALLPKAPRPAPR